MLLGTFCHLLDNASALQCLGSVHAALKPGGKFVLELSHPTDVFDGTLLQETEWDSAEDLPPADGVPGELAVQYGSPGDDFDAIDQVDTCFCLASSVLWCQRQQGLLVTILALPAGCHAKCTNIRGG